MKRLAAPLATADWSFPYKTGTSCYDAYEDVILFRNNAVTNDLQEMGQLV